MTTNGPQRQSRSPWLAIVTGTAIAGGILAAIIVPRVERERAARDARLREPRLVETVVVQSAPWTINLALDGTAVPVAAVSIHAPAVGQVESVVADIGQRVTRGQVLATLHLAEPLVGPTESGAPADKVVALLDGIVTHRNCEVGTTAGPAGAALFEVADTSTLKAYVDVPQTLAPWVHVGESVAVVAKAVPSGAITGTVVRTAAALDQATHTMRIEVQMPGERLLAGSAVTVRFAVTRQVTPPMVPARALVFGTSSASACDTSSAASSPACRDRRGMLWPRVIRLIDGRAHYAAIELGWDRGHEVEIVSGVEVGDVVLLSPAENIREGEPLRVNEATALAEPSADDNPP